MEYVFKCYGHPNITAQHVRTIEFTKDSEISLSGDCILGVKANFDKEELKKFCGKIRILMECSTSKETFQEIFQAVVNPNFDSDEEIVFRKSLYQSPRTYGHFLNHGAKHISRKMVAALRKPDTIIYITIKKNKTPFASAVLPTIIF